MVENYNFVALENLFQTLEHNRWIGNWQKPTEATSERAEIEMLLRSLSLSQLNNSAWIMKTSLERQRNVF